MIIIRDMVVQD